jgi:hypothetical protein
MTEPGSPHRGHDPGAASAEDEQTFSDVYNGFTFGGGGGRRKKKKDKEPEPPPPPPVAPSQPPTVQHLPPVSAAPQEPARPELPYRPHPALPPKAQEISWPETGVAPVDPVDADAEAGQEAPAIVRAYAWTRGRTTTQFKLEIETLLTVGDRYRSTDEWMQAEYHSIAALCRQPRSVAEVAALLSIPLGVAKVLLGDMAAQGLLVVHEVAGTDGQGPDLVLMERILSGLRRL